MDEHRLPIIWRYRCMGCGACVRGCPTQAIALQAGKAAVVAPIACTYCAACEGYCPTGAIAVPFQIFFAPRG